MNSSGFCGFFAGDRELGRFVLCGSNETHPSGKEQNAQDAVGEDLPDMVTAASSIYKVNSCNDQPDNS